MKVLFARLTIFTLLIFSSVSLQAQATKEGGQKSASQSTTAVKAPQNTSAAASDASAAPSSAMTDSAEADMDSVANDAFLDETLEADTAAAPVETVGFHKALKKKFIEGNAGFMSLVALALVLGLAFCIERIIYLSLSEINAKKFMRDLDEKISAGDIEGAKAQCGETRGPVAAICSQGLDRIDDSIDNVERAVVSYGSVQSANLEKGCSWITLFIAMSPSLGFLGTVIGMVIAFDQIQQAGDISPTIVAAGMKVALITTIFGIIAALILQIFYNYILSKIEHLTAQMEESVISLLDSIMKYKLRHEEA
jgi:biopolymer transport protein ExbB